MERNEAPPKRPSLLLVDDDALLATTLARALYDRGFEVTIARDMEEALRAISEETPRHAVVDLRIGGQSGLSLIPRLRQAGPDTRVVVLTGYASIATAVQAVKLGADEYLTKPTDADAIAAALRGESAPGEISPPARPLSPDRLEWEHIQRVLAEHHGNITATAEALGMHRRTLQRKLGKRPPRGN
jgi:two-component system response regulator RegA